MITKHIRIAAMILASGLIFACGQQAPVDIDSILAKEKTYVGSDTCKQCHLEHYDSWKMTQHSRMLQDAKANVDAIIVPIDEKRIRADLANWKISSKYRRARFMSPQWMISFTPSAANGNSVSW